MASGFRVRKGARAARGGAAGLALAALVVAGACGGGADPLAESGRRLEVVADDGTRLEVVEFRTRAGSGKAPAVAAWPLTVRDLAECRRSLAPWGQDGRTLWIVATPARDGLELADVGTVLDALSASPGVDPGRVGAVVAGPAAEALAHRVDPSDPGAAALVLIVGVAGGPLPPGEHGRCLVILAGEAGESAVPFGLALDRADAWLARQLGLTQ